ncbi:MAG: pyrroloquinoline quinone biosynthesis protein PqqB [Deltaproteobacteria bacterium]|nr:pyrroloquinoline quinone biosynthesis protein PqqB [Deltaproteobacteria bacterium]
MLANDVGQIGSLVCEPYRRDGRGMDRWLIRWRLTPLLLAPWWLTLCVLGLVACHEPVPVAESEPSATEASATEGLAPKGLATEPFLIVLGIAQDAGYPQAGCSKACCRRAGAFSERRRHASSLALVDPETSQRWLFEATPDFRHQLQGLDERFPPESSPGLAGIFLTHAHMGHYTGLLHLGREVMGAQGVPVFAMPRMGDFLESNGPWEQLVELGNIALQPLESGIAVQLNERLRVTPILVPHRDEYSETVGFLIEGPQRSVFFLPDIDKWERWETPIESLLERVDIAYLDGTFYSDGEIPGRDMAEIPHPFIAESLRRFSALGEEDRSKVRFIHLNHTNPALQPDSEAREEIEALGFSLAEELEEIRL